MFFWVIALIMTGLIAAFVLQPLSRTSRKASDNADVAVYKAQLAEIDRDLARGVLTEEDAEAARTEVARRLLAADAAEKSSVSDGPRRPLQIAVIVALFLVSLGTYILVGAPGEPDLPLAQRLANAEDLLNNRPDQATLEAAVTLPEPPEAAPELVAAVEELREVMAERPDDLTGLGFLARYEAELGNFADAARAQQRIVDIKGAEASIEDRRILLDLMTSATAGFVSPEAEDVLRGILEEDDQNMAARYHLGALYDRTARPDVAFRIWRPLVESGAETYHTSLARLQIANAAERAGIEYTPPEIRGPGLDDIAAAEDMSEEDRAAMIGGMVNGLADRLATQGGTASDWARLIRAYGVLGEAQLAADVWTEAQQVFGADAGAIALLQEAATAAGVAQ